MKKLLVFSAAIEAVTGLLLLTFPSLVAEVLCGSELAANGIAVGRIAGVSLISLAVACWPCGTDDRAFLGQLLYNSSVGVYLTCLGLRGEFVGKLLWPAAGFHIVVTVLFAVGRGRALSASRSNEKVEL